MEVKEAQETEDREKAATPDKWKKVTRKAMELKVTLKKLANAIPPESQEEIHQEVREILHDTGWVDKDKEDTENSSGPERAQTEIIQETEIDRSAARGWANTTEGKRLLEGVLEVAASIRFWRHQNGTMRNSEKESRGVTTSTKISKSGGDRSEPLQSKILRVITSKTKGAAKWKALLNGRTFRAASAIHHMNCLYVRELLSL